MEVTTATPSVERSRAVLTELLLADQPRPRGRPQGDHDRRQRAARPRPPVRRRAGRSRRLPRAAGRGTDDSNPVIAVDHDACILCDRCVRACDDIQGNDVIGRSGKGYATRIAFDLNDPMGESSCVTCGECVGGLPDRGADQQADPQRPDPAARASWRGRHGLPVLRRRLRADLPRRRRAQRDLLRRGPRAARLAEPAVRQGPLRLGLRGLAAAADHAAHPPRGVLPQGPAVRRRARRESDAPRKGAAASPAAWSTTTRSCRTSARPPGRRRSTWSPGG